MSNAPEPCDDEEVKAFLERKGKHYQNLLNKIEELLSDYRSSPAGKAVVYNIYSRKQKEDDDIFKEVWKIREKVNLYRLGTLPSDECAERTDTISRNYKIDYLPDIVALTVVVLYSSDIKHVREIIDRKIDEKVLISYVNTKKKKKKSSEAFYGENKCDGGYYAHHYTLGHTYRMLEGLRCELQIKTALHDVLGAKSHDLTYKPQGVIDKRMKRQIEILGDSIQAIEQQSELLKDLIQQRWVIEQKRQRAASLQLLRLPPSTEVAQKKRKYQRIKSKLDTDHTLTSAEFDSKKMQGLIDQIDSLVESTADYHDACRLFTLLGVVSNKTEFFDLALGRIDAWFLASREDEEKYDALIFKALAHYCFGQILQAIFQSKEAFRKYKIPLREGESDQKVILRRNLKKFAAMTSLAYYYAEIAGSDPATKLRARQEAERLVDEMRPLAKEFGSHQLINLLFFEDTRGAIKIAFAESVEDVQEGLGICKEAHATVKEDFPAYKLLFSEYLDLHERRAFQRIFDLEQIE